MFTGPDPNGTALARAFRYALALWLLRQLYAAVVRSVGYRGVRAITGWFPVSRMRVSVLHRAMTQLLLAGGRYTEQPARCLEWAISSTWLLRLMGHPAHVVVGVTTAPFTAHAWVEIEHTSYDPAGHLDEVTYIEIDRF